MQKKYKQMLLVPAILLTALVISTVLSNQKEPARKRPEAARQKSIKTYEVVNGSIPAPVTLYGPLTAYNRAELYAEVTGLLLDTEKRLKTGHRYAAGELLLHIDDRVYRNTVLAQKSSLLNQITQLIPDLTIDYPGSVPAWQAYLESFDLQKPLVPLPDPVSATERYYIASRNIYTQYYSVKSMEETLAKYRIAAPFDGVVTDADINPGTLIRSGTRVATFTGSGHFEMEAAATPIELKRLAVGQKAVLHSEDIGGAFAGVVTRINTVLEPSSQTFRVYIESRDNRLKDGLYMSAAIAAPAIDRAFMLPKTVLEKNNRVYTVETGALVLTPVTVTAETGDQVIVQGLEDGQRVLAEKIVGAYPGMPFDLQNDDAPEPGEGKGNGAGQAAEKRQGER
ncbi:HlyD family efflux transporter periplasmic adaptor subunit [bacterium]|nr:HlyD family efflux transporter periplasmic adaptor subunit [bacterium]